MRDFARANHTFESLVVYDHWRKNISGIEGGKEPEEMVVGLVPGSYFELLRIRPLMGRLFTEEENQYGKHYVAAIGAGFWRTRFAADPGILGRTLRINAETYVIVAVMPDVVPAWMDQTSAPISIWTPFAFADIWTEASRGERGDFALGRLKPGVSFDQARAELAALAAGLARDHPIDEGIGAAIEPLADTRAGPVRPVLLMLAGAVAMVLAIACSNLAGLLLARNSARSREIAVRAALGAGKWRLLRQLLVETLLLSLSGGAAGLVLSSVASTALVRFSAAGALPYTTAANSLPQFWSAGVDLRVLPFTFGISVVTALLFGLAPAFAGLRVPPGNALKEGSRGSGAGLGRQRFRRVLVVAEMALSLVLVVAAGLLVESMIRLQRQNLGFRPDRLLKAHLYLPPARYPDSAAITQFCDEFGRRASALPGVLDASVTTVFPPSIRWTQMFTIEGRPASRISEVPAARFGVVDAAYLRTMGMTLVEGRDFAESDTAASLPVALVNQEFVRQYFPDEDPIGRQIRLGAPPGLAAAVAGRAGSASGSIAIVGVTGNFLNAGMAMPPAPQILALFRQQPGLNYGFKDIVLRTAMDDPENMAPAVARELRSLDPDIPLGEVQSMSGYLNHQTADARFTTALLGLFAGLGTILAVIGAYGVVSYLVVQRTHELGVRIALGAGSGSILWLVLRQGISMGLARNRAGPGWCVGHAPVPGAAPLWHLGNRSVDSWRRIPSVPAGGRDGQRHTGQACHADRPGPGPSQRIAPGNASTTLLARASRGSTRVARRAGIQMAAAASANRVRDPPQQMAPGNAVDRVAQCLQRVDRVARRAGIQMAAAATAASSSGTAVKVTGSTGATPKSSDAIDRVNNAAAASPAASPAPAISPPWRNTCARICAGWAPRAARRPISRLLCDTKKLVTPYSPTEASSSAVSPKRLSSIVWKRFSSRDEDSKSVNGLVRTRRDWARGLHAPPHRFDQCRGVRGGLQQVVRVREEAGHLAEIDRRPRILGRTRGRGYRSPRRRSGTRSFPRQMLLDGVKAAHVPVHEAAVHHHLGGVLPSKRRRQVSPESSGIPSTLKKSGLTDSESAKICWPCDSVSRPTMPNCCG